jgi:hypothetical protein
MQSQTIFYSRLTRPLVSLGVRTTGCSLRQLTLTVRSLILLAISAFVVKTLLRSRQLSMMATWLSLTQKNDKMI